MTEWNLYYVVLIHKNGIKVSFLKKTQNVLNSKKGWLIEQWTKVISIFVFFNVVYQNFHRKLNKSEHSKLTNLKKLAKKKALHFKVALTSPPTSQKLFIHTRKLLLFVTTHPVNELQKHLSQQSIFTKYRQALSDNSTNFVFYSSYYIFFNSYFE